MLWAKLRQLRMHTGGALSPALRRSGQNKTLSVGYPGQGGRGREKPVQGQRPRAQSTPATIPVESRPAATTSPGILKETHTLRIPPDFLHHTLWEAGPSNLCFNKPSKQLWYALKFETHCYIWENDFSPHFFAVRWSWWRLLLAVGCGHRCSISFPGLSF